jgi:AcrR family transcriptional regulator
MPTENRSKRDALTVKLNHVLLREGIDAPTMSSLATSIGISRASLYLSFKNKADVVGEVVNRHLAFMKLNPIPATLHTEQFPKVFLDSLLLLGSTTDLFLSELHRSFPALWEQLNAAESAHFAQWNRYVAKAQRAHYLIKEMSPDFLLFHMRTSVRSALASVSARDITLTDSQDYLRTFATVLLRGITTEPEAALARLAHLRPYENRIFTEFRETY